MGLDAYRVIMEICSFKTRRYFRADKPCHVRIATEFSEAEIKLYVRTPGEDASTSYVVRDAFLEGRYTECQTIAWEQLAEPLSLSVTGTIGYLTSPRYARQQALEQNISWLEESETNMDYIRQNSGKNFRSAVSAARWILETDGEYTGMDLHDEVSVGKGTRVLLTHSCGMVHDELKQAFPELKPLFPWHMSDMKAGTPDQMQALDIERERIRTEIGTQAVYQWDYKRQTLFLADHDLLESPSDEIVLVKGQGMRSARGYRYGSGWVAHRIPDDVLACVHTLAMVEERKVA